MALANYLKRTESTKQRNKARKSTYTTPFSNMYKAYKNSAAKAGVKRSKINYEQTVSNLRRSMQRMVNSKMKPAIKKMEANKFKLEQGRRALMQRQAMIESRMKQNKNALVKINKNISTANSELKKLNKPKLSNANKKAIFEMYKRAKMNTNARYQKKLGKNFQMINLNFTPVLGKANNRPAPVPRLNAPKRSLGRSKTI